MTGPTPSRKRTPADPSETDKDYRDLQSATIPPEEPLVDTGHRLLEAQQLAERDAASGAYDSDGVEAAEGPLPSEWVIDAQTELDRAENEKRRHSAARIGAEHVMKAENGDYTPPTDGASGSLTYTRERLEGAQEDLRRAQQDHERRHEQLGDISAVVATRQTAPKTRAHWWRRVWVPTLAGGLLELAATAGNVYVFMRLGDWFQAGTVALSAVFALTIAPLVAGLVLAGLRHVSSVKEIIARAIAAALLIAVWIIAGLTLAGMRVEADRELAADRSNVTSSLDSAAEQLGQAAAAATTSPQAEDSTLEIAFWAVVLLGIGAVLLVKEAIFHETARLAELDDRIALWQCEDAAAGWTSRAAAIRHRVSLQQLDIQLTDRVYTTEFDKLLLRGERAKSEYRASLVNAFADPEMTTSLEDRFARNRAVQSAPRFQPHDDVELPEWTTAAAELSGEEAS